jgi:hypothetical protein
MELKILEIYPKQADHITDFFVREKSTANPV